ncbi:hypothetical protein PIB30_072693 [Stylosanthes scabra]|uniref:Uncharacterized protein n=1 Tax=Stylosanthes scabra TaxID=79078 RepID=A0ABU6QP69_9FABA|nr:hypothetical protein [Stylosanthes scabra]
MYLNSEYNSSFFNSALLDILMHFIGCGRIVQMANSNSGSNLNTESDPSGSAVVTNQTAAQIQNSNSEHIRQDSGNNNNGNQTVNSGGNNRGTRPRITQPPFNSAVNAGWPPYGLPQNYNPPFVNSNFGNCKSRSTYTQEGVN